MEENINNNPQQETIMVSQEGQATKHKTNREIFEQNIRDKYPDLDEEGLYKYAQESYARKKKDLSDLQESSGSLIDVLETSPDAIALFQAISLNGDFEDGLQVLDEDTLQRALERKQSGYKLSDEELEKKISTHRQNLSDRKAFKKLLEKNSAKTLKNIEDYAKNTGKTPEEVIDSLTPFLQKIHDNDIDESILNALYLDNIKNAEYERGLTDGKNGKIKESTLKGEKVSGLPRPKGFTGEEKGTEQKHREEDPFAFMVDDD